MTGAAQECIVVGAGGHARAVTAIVLEQGSRLRCRAIVDVLGARAVLTDERVLGIPVEFGVARLDHHRAQGVPIAFLALGTCRDRRLQYDRCATLGYQLPNLLSSSALLGREVALGYGNVVCPRSFIGPAGCLGDNNIVNTGAIIDHEVRIGDDCHIAPAAAIAGRVIIGSRVFVGLGSRIIDGRTICSDVTIGAGGVVTRDISEPGVYVGVPVRRLRA